MIAKAVPELGPLEFELLRILWRRGKATSGELLEEASRSRSKPLAYTTVSTLLTRMVEKGVLEVDRARQPFRFSPRVGRDQVLRQRVRDFVDVFFDGSAVELAVRLVEQGPLSQEELRRLEGLFREQKPSRVRSTRRPSSGGKKRS